MRQADEGVLNSSGNTYANEVLIKFTGGIAWDSKLIEQEMRVQKAWLSVLESSQVLRPLECQRVSDVLDQIRKAMIDGEFAWRESDEDIHMNIERAVTEQLGELGKKMHVGRSRNDLIATTLRLYVADQCEKQMGEITAITQQLLQHAAEHLNTIVPAMTHLQNGQPISLAQILLSHAWGFTRDLEMFSHARKMALYSMPLGAAACNGTTLAADFEKIAAGLGFRHACLNSYDAISSRDELLVFHDALALNSVHTARFAQDIILWASSAFGLAKLHQNWSTGSSIMPNKRNPDVMELCRAKAARLQGAAQIAKQICSQLGSSYYSDFHELKKVTLEAVAVRDEINSVFAPFVAGLRFDPAAAKALMQRGHVMATDYANQLTENGSSFREAYQEVAAQVALADQQGVQVDSLVSGLSPKRSIEQRNASGGTSSKAMQSQIKKIHMILDSQGGSQ